MKKSNERDMQATLNTLRKTLMKPIGEGDANLSIL